MWTSFRPPGRGHRLVAAGGRSCTWRSRQAAMLAERCCRRPSAFMPIQVAIHRRRRTTLRARGSAVSWRSIETANRGTKWDRGRFETRLPVTFLRAFTSSGAKNAIVASPRCFRFGSVCSLRGKTPRKPSTSSGSTSFGPIGWKNHGLSAPISVGSSPDRVARDWEVVLLEPRIAEFAGDRVVQEAIRREVVSIVLLGRSRQPDSLYIVVAQLSASLPDDMTNGSMPA